MSGSDPTGYNWFSDIVSGDNSSGWTSSTFFGGAVAIVGGAYVTMLYQQGAFAQGGSMEGFSGSSGAGGAIAVAEAINGLSDPGANATYAAPTGELGSGATLYNEGAGAPPPQTDNRLAAVQCGTPERCQQLAWEVNTMGPMGGVVIQGGVRAATLFRAALQWLFRSAGGRHIALGLERFGLKEVAAKVGAETLLADPNWKATLLAEIGNPATRFTVSVEGLAGKSVADKVLSAAAKGAVPGASPTNWELAQLYQAGRLGEVTFVNRLAEVLANPF